jgi:beta-lactamase class C
MGTSRPNGIEYEVMDMIYGLPFKDWLKLSSGEGGLLPAAPLPEESETEAEAGAEGQGDRGRPDQR